MAGPQRPVKVETVAGSVYARLRRGILDGWIEPGARLRQVTLAQQLGVSRTPLREALIRLAAEGLVDLEPNHGARVVDGVGDGARATWELRLVLEPGIARLAAQRRARPGIDQLRATVSDTGDGRSFHLAL
ncbi:MAG: GntR family transcriptional regulator, partial [Gaiellales bacterium]